MKRVNARAELEAKVRSEVALMVQTAARWQRGADGSRFMEGLAEGAAYAGAGVLFALEGGSSAYVSHADQQARADELLRAARVELDAKEPERPAGARP